MATTISVRRIDPLTFEPAYGSGQGDYITDQAAVTQIIMTTLGLLEGEWWESLEVGTPLLQQILQPGAGKNPDLISMLLQARIRSCPYVLDVLAVSTTYNVQTRQFAFTCSVETAFGTLNLSSDPGLSAVIGN